MNPASCSGIVVGVPWGRFILSFLLLCWISFGFVLPFLSGPMILSYKSVLGWLLLLYITISLSFSFTWILPCDLVTWPGWSPSWRIRQCTTLNTINLITTTNPKQKRQTHCQTSNKEEEWGHPSKQIQTLERTTPGTKHLSTTVHRKTCAGKLSTVQLYKLNNLQVQMDLRPPPSEKQK